MKSTRPWFWDFKALRALGLKVTVVERYNRRAWWAICSTCRESVLALACQDCCWDLASLILVANHVKALCDVRKGLALFGCANGCNRAMIEHPPAALLVAQAEEAAAGNSGRAREEVQGRRKGRAAAR